jgi:hypothetical protein
MDANDPIDPRAFHAEYPTCLASAVASEVVDVDAAEDRLGWRPLEPGDAFRADALTVDESCDGSLGLTAMYEYGTSGELLLILQGSGTHTIEAAPTGVPTEVGRRTVQWLEGPPDGTIGVFRFGQHDGAPLFATVFGYNRTDVEELIRSLK